VRADDDVAAYHRELVARLRGVLRGDLVGVYAGGSVALGGYVPGRSDLDVAAVCRDALPRERKQEIVEALRHEALPCPARGLEFVVYPERAVRNAVTEAGFDLDLNTGRAMAFHVAFEPSAADRHWYVLDRAILAERGVALAGPPPRELFAPIPRASLLAILAEAVRWHEPGGAARHDDAVLNACRAWRFAAEGVWSSKQDAGTWALAREDDTELVATALEARESAAPLDPERVKAFLERVVRLLDSANAAS
jgi:hypothetical protein